MTESLMIDAEHPWPWLEAFPEYAAAFFNGREEDAEALLRCVLAAPVTVLFGKSGLGKSSLLQAGLFPGLRKERLLPVYVRLVHESVSACASEQIARRLEEELRRTRKQDITNEFTPLAYRLRQASESDGTEAVPLTEFLWAELHRADIELADADGRRWHPVFVLDQFEEIFTLATDQERQKQTLYELGDLIENRIPKALAERLHADDELYDQLNLDTQNYRFLLSLREDYLADLEEWADLIPRLGSNRYRILPMSGPQAIAAVEKTGESLVTHEDAVNIIHYLSQTQTQTSQEPSAHRRRGQIQVEPTLLSLMCSGLNAERLKNKKERLATGNLATEGGLIVERFYDQAFAGMPETLRDFVEQHLITADGVRLPYPARSVEAEKLATAEQIKTLVDKRLIRRESLEEGDRIELVHDRLAQVALQRRLESQRRKEALRQQRLRLRWWIGTAVVMVLLLAFAGFMARATWKAEQALLDATAMRLIAEGGAITAGVRSGGAIRGLFKELAAHRLSPSLYSYEALQNEYLRFRELVFVRKGTAISVAYSPDGARILSRSSDDTSQLWDAKTGQPIGQPLQGHLIAFSSDSARILLDTKDDAWRLWNTATGEPIGEPTQGHVVAFNPNVDRIVSIDSDNFLRLWDAKTGRPIGQPFQGHLAALSSDGTRLVSDTGDKSLQLWDANTGQPLGQPLIDHDGGTVRSVNFSPDGARIVSGSSDKTLRLWDANTGQLIGKPLTAGYSQEPIFFVAFNSNGSRIVTKKEEQTGRDDFDDVFWLWNAETGEKISELSVGGEVAFSPDGSKVLSNSNRDPSLFRLSDAESGRSICELRLSSGADVAFSPDGKSMVSAGDNNSLRLGSFIDIIDCDFETLKGHEGKVYSAVFSPDGEYIVSSGADDTLRLWDRRKHQFSHVLIDEFALSPDGNLIIVTKSNSSPNVLYLLDAKTGQPIGQPLVGHTNNINSVAFSQDGSRIVSGDQDGTLLVWDSKTGQSIGQPLRNDDHREGYDAIHYVAFSPDGNRIFSQHSDGMLRQWDANTGQLLSQPIKGHEGKVNMIALSPDGNRIVSRTEYNMLQLWDAKTGQPIGQPLKGYESSVTSVAFSPDARYIISGSNDQTMRLWDVKTGQPLGQPIKSDSYYSFPSVDYVAFSPNNRNVVYKAGSIGLLDVFEGWADALCSKLGRNMSHKEWREWVSPDIGYEEKYKQCPGLPIPPDEPGPTSVIRK